LRRHGVHGSQSTTYRQANRPRPHLPAISTVHAALDCHGLLHRRRRRRHTAAATLLSRPMTPNPRWCADYKGKFMLGDRRNCC
jgi:hypothetical protein